MVNSTRLGEIFFDVSLLAPPEPLEVALEQAQQLPRGKYLRMFHRMEPCVLYGHLDDRGFGHKVIVEKPGQVHILIWHLDDPQGAALANGWLKGT